MSKPAQREPPRSPRARRWAWASAATALLLAGAALWWMRWNAPPASEAPVYRLSMPGRVVALTFDDGPFRTTTPKILDILKARGIHATFFLRGDHAHAYPDLVRREAREGHVLGNHTWDHKDLPTLTRAGRAQELDRCQAVVTAISGRRPVLFRPPKGLYTRDTLTLARERGLRMILWSFATEHHDAPTVPTMVARALRQIVPGTIILAHDTRTITVKALPAILDGLLARGYRFVTVPQGLAGR